MIVGKKEELLGLHKSSGGQPTTLSCFRARVCIAKAWDELVFPFSLGMRVNSKQVDLRRYIARMSKLNQQLDLLYPQMLVVPYYNILKTQHFLSCLITTQDGIGPDQAFLSPEYLH